MLPVLLQHQTGWLRNDGDPDLSSLTEVRFFIIFSLKDIVYIYIFYIICTHVFPNSISYVNDCLVKLQDKMNAAEMNTGLQNFGPLFI